MKSIQSCDFRFISNRFIEAEESGSTIIDVLSHEEISLFKNWFYVFDKHLCFISDVLNSSYSPSWIIDEGIWRYKTGDRPDYEALKNKFDYSGVNPNAYDHETNYFDSLLNSTSIYQSNDKSNANLPLSAPLAEIYQDIIHNLDSEFSNMVIIRSKIIEQYLNSSSSYSISDVKNACTGIFVNEITKLYISCLNG